MKEYTAEQIKDIHKYAYSEKGCYDADCYGCAFQGGTPCCDSSPIKCRQLLVSKKFDSEAWREILAEILFEEAKNKLKEKNNVR